MEQLVAFVMPVQDSVTESVDCTVDALEVNVAMPGPSVTVAVFVALPPDPVAVKV
jgi:hypothetical protein